MRTTLSLEPDVIRAAKQLAAAQSKSLGAVISELARKGLKGGTIKISERNGFPIFDVPVGVRPFSPEDVKRAEEEDDEYHAGRFT